MKSSKHFYEEPQTREDNLADLVIDHLGDMQLPEIFGIKRPFGIIVRLQKHLYRRNGDVDIVFVPLSNWIETQSIDISCCMAVEVKSCHFDESGKFKSLKPDKHKKPIERLIEEGWGRIFLCDIIESIAAEGWFHNLGFMIRDEFKKQVDIPGCGHIMTSVHPVAGRGEDLSGSIGGPEILSKAEPFKRTSLSDFVEEALSALFGGFIDRDRVKSVDWIIRLKWNPDKREYFEF